MVEALGPISARPPTPPRTTSRMLSQEAKDRTEGSPATIKTPRDSPFSTNGSTGAPSSRHSKKVEFSPWANYIKPPTFTNSSLKPQSDLKALPRSNECKPSKSILKATHTLAPVSSPNDDPFTPESFAMLLESITQQLAGESTSGRLDAYMQLFGALRAYDGLPGDREIPGKLGLLTQFIQRDVTRDLGNRGPLETNLVIQALKLSVALVWHPEISAQLSDEFKIFLVDHAINCLRDVKASKSVVTSCMPILSTHNFPPKIMTTARLTRLLTALHDVTTRVNGSAIISQRLSIYQRILNQSKSTFLSHSTFWVEHLMSGLLHHLKDTRLKAISLGSHISMAFGPNLTLSKSIRDLFDKTLGNNRKMVIEICERMTRMMGSVDSGVHVPQVWSVIILLLRNKRSSIDQWEHFKDWLLVIQKCFNCIEPAIKTQAMNGWNRFVYVINPNETTTRTVIKMLSRPILSQIERKKQEKHSANQVALSGYYNLIYYAFRPSATHQHLDIVWEEYIALPSSGVFASVPVLNDRFSQVLSNMLWSSQARVWSENRVNESAKYDPEELPSLDCRWVRSRITSVLKVFENIFRSSVWTDDANGIEKSNIAGAWISLSKALSYASSKEITPSAESMQAVANVLGLLQRLWNAGPPSLNASEDNEKFFDRFRFLSTTIIFSLGSIPFTEKLLLKTADETFQAANTPTHRHPRGNSDLDSPILHFLRMISDVSGITEPTPSYLRLINGTLEAACNGRVSRGSRLEILRQCADLYPNVAEFHFGVHNYAQIVWKSTAQLAADCLCSFPIESARERDGSVLRDYENVVKILSAGLKFSDVSQVWNQLLDSFVRVVRTEKGDQAIAKMIIESLAACVMELRVRDTYLPSTSLLGHSLSIPYCQGTLNSKESFTEASSRNGNAHMLFPHKLVALVDKTLHESYGGFDASETSGIADFIESLTSFLGSGVLAFRSSILESLQQPLALWLKDEVRQLNVECGVESRILTAIRALSSAVLNILQASSPHDAQCLQKFEPIICAGLDSSHMSIAKRFVETWRSTFGLQESLVCPMSISRALVKLELYLKSQPSANDSQDQSNSGSQDKHGGSKESSKSRKAVSFGDSVETSTSIGFNSSPVTKVNQITDMSSDQSIERRPLRSEGASEQVDELPLPVPTSAEVRSQRKEVFSMIDSLKSSSPAVNTPRELGFMTPPHLRNLRNVAENETPLTPTLAAVPEDNFLGSSPTPGTRARPQASGSELSSLSEPHMDVDTDKELPSSPPELKSLNPNARNKQGSGKKKNSSSRSQSNALKEQPVKDQNMTPETTKPSKRRLRSSASKKSANKKSGANASPQKGRHERILEDAKPASQEKTVAPTTTTEKNQLPNDNNEKPNKPVSETVDSSSDEMDTQIASQLEQDMGLVAGVKNDDAKLSDELPHSVPMTRKRKREVEDTQTPPKKDRRRSSRITKEFTTDEVQETRNTRATRSFQDQPTSKPSPVVPSAKKRKMQSRSDANESTKSKPIDQDDGARDDLGKEPEVPEPSSQKRRRSNRLGGVSGPPIPEETPDRKKPSRPRKRESGRSGAKSQKSELPEEDDEVEIASPTVSNDSKADDDEAEVEVIDMQDSTESHEPVHEIPESLVENVIAKVEPPISPDTAEDVQMNDAEATSDKPSQPETTERAVSQTTENEEISTEGDILQSLRRVLDDAKSAKLDRRTVKEIDELLFDIRVETLEALRRHTE